MAFVQRSLEGDRTYLFDGATVYVVGGQAASLIPADLTDTGLAYRDNLLLNAHQAHPEWKGLPNLTVIELALGEYELRKQKSFG